MAGSGVTAPPTWAGPQALQVLITSSTEIRGGSTPGAGFWRVTAALSLVRAAAASDELCNSSAGGRLVCLGVDHCWAERMQPSLPCRTAVHPVVLTHIYQHLNASHMQQSSQPTAQVQQKGGAHCLLAPALPAAARCTLCLFMACQPRS